METLNCEAPHCKYFSGYKLHTKSQQQLNAEWHLMVDRQIVIELEFLI
jgi:hypothetical protein